MIRETYIFLILLSSCLEYGDKVKAKLQSGECFVHRAEADGFYQVIKVTKKNYHYQEFKQVESKELIYPISVIDQDYLSVSCPKKN